MRYIAKTLQGLEPVLEQELHRLGIQETELQNRAVYFEGDQAALYKAIYNSRTALHILRPVAEFDIETQQDLYDYLTREVAWEKLFAVDAVLAFDTQCFDSVFTHSQFASRRVKDAVVDRFRRQFGQRPWVDGKDYQVRVDVYMKRNHVVVSLDAAGASLHRRGYKAEQGRAPVSEVLAAGLVALSGWQPSQDFYDPMCGSGTIVMEAAMMASAIPAGFYRKEYAFQHWNDYDPNLWKAVRKEADAAIGEAEGRIFASDLVRHNVDMVQANLVQARLHHDVQLFQADFFTAEPPCETGVLVFNPPYGARLALPEAEDFYRRIGDTLKQRYTGFEAYVLSAHAEALKHLGLRTHKRMTLFNGPLECKYFGYRLR